LAARADVRRLQEELARAQTTDTKEEAAVARAASLEGVNALLEAAVAGLQREWDKARHCGAEDQEELSRQLASLRTRLEAAHEAEKESLGKEVENEATELQAELKKQAAAGATAEVVDKVVAGGCRGDGQDRR
jgi:hypothetical protein